MAKTTQRFDAFGSATAQYVNRHGCLAPIIVHSVSIALHLSDAQTLWQSLNLYAATMLLRRRTQVPIAIPQGSKKKAWYASIAAIIIMPA